MLVVVVAMVLVGDTVVMMAENPSDVHPDVGGGARIAATITGMSSVVEGQGEGSEAECLLRFSVGSCVSLSLGVRVLAWYLRDVVIFFLGMVEQLHWL